MRLKLVLLMFLMLTLPALARDTVDHWFQVRSEHFLVLTDTNEKQARRVAGQFERMRSIFHTLIPTASGNADTPITVLALKDKKEFEKLEPEAYLAKGQLELAGLFLQAPDKGYILLRMDAKGEHPYATVYHEYTHYLLRNAAVWMPLWLNEGLAEFYQNTDIREKEAVLGQPSQDDILYLRQNRLLPLTTLFTVDRRSPYYHEEQKGSVFYAESWALTHMIEISDRQKGTNRLKDYSERLLKKEDPLAAAQGAFGDLNQLQKSLDSYISRDSFTAFIMNPAASVNESSFQAEAITGSDADAVRADVLVYDDRTKDAQALIDTTLRDDPKNALAHETMGYLKFREGDFSAARKWYGEAVQLNSRSYLAQYYYAALSMKSGGEGKDAEIESSFRASIKLNPSFAPAYDALAMHLYRMPDKADQAYAFDLQAIGLEPGNVNYRLNAASVQMQMQHFDIALQVLSAAKRAAQTPEEVAMVQSRIDQIARVQAAIAHTPQAESPPADETTSASVTDTRSFTVKSSDGREYSIKPDAKQVGPIYPTEAPTGAHHTVRGVIRAVRCSYPSVLTLNIEQPNKAAAITLYRNDFYKIDFTVLNFTPKSDLNPCTDIEGLKAKVDYAEVSDKTVAGQILSVELSK